MRDFLNKRWIGGLNLIANRAREHKASVFEAMVADINALGIEHVLCTGDVTNVALPSEFAFARQHFDAFDGGPERITVLPGNHDAYVGDGVPLFHDAFRDYYEADPGWGWSNGTPWPTVRLRGPVAIIGLSTSQATPWFKAWGEIGGDQLERAEAVLSDERLADKVRIVAIHHPPAGKHAAHQRHGLRDHGAFADMIGRTGADLVLHGHEHQDMRHDLAGPAGDPVPVHGIQSATYAGGKANLRARYRVYTVNGEREVDGGRLRVWDPAAGAFVDDASS